MFPEKSDLQKKSSPFSLSPVTLLATNMNRFVWLLRHKICFAFLLCQQTKKSLENTAIIQLFLLIK